ncbi:hypothetical protein Tco_1577936 [Tanacetum coccineum]
MSTLVFVDPEISTQADEAQSSRVPDPVETEAPESPHTVAPPTSLPDSTPPTLVPILRRTTRIGVRVLPAMSLGLSTSMAKVEAMSDLAFRKRFRSSYESSPYSSPPDLTSWKRYRGTFELVEDDKEEEDEEGDEEEEDEEIEESSDSDSVSEDAKDDVPTVEDEDPAAGDEGLAAGDEGPGIGVKSLSLGGDEAVPEGQPRVAPVVETAVGEPLGLGYGELRRQEIALGEGWMPSVFEVAYIDVPAYPPPAPPAQTSPSPEWLSGSLPISTEPFIRENRKLRLQLVEDRRVRLDLAKIVDSIRRGQEPREDV